MKTLLKKFNSLNTELQDLLRGVICFIIVFPLILLFASLIVSNLPKLTETLY